MVNRGLGCCLAALLLIAADTAGASASTLDLRLKSRSIEFGDPLRLELRAAASAPPLERIDLGPLRARFAVEIPADVDTASQPGEQRWDLRLYPRRPGALTIPSLSLGGSRTPAVPVVATPAVDHTDQVPIGVSAQVSNTSVWVNQPVTVAMTIDTGSRFAQLDAEAMQQDGLEIVGPTLVSRAAGPQGVRYTLRWRIYPQAAGVRALQLPPARYARDGVVTHRFYPPPLQLHVRPLPSYVPPTMPVGRVRIDATLPDRLFLVNHRLAFLALRISERGPPGENHAALLRQLSSSRTLRFYPPRTIRHADEDAGASRSTVYEIPFAAQSMGLLHLPPIRVQYFDPATGKIRTRTEALGTLVVFDPWLVYAGRAALAVLALWLLRRLALYLQAKWRRYRRYAAALQTLREGDTPDSLQSALREMATAEGWQGNITLAAWSTNWQRCFPRLSSVSESVLQLQAALYGGAHADHGAIRAALIEACHRRVPPLKAGETLRAAFALLRQPR